MNEIIKVFKGRRIGKIPKLKKYINIDLEITVPHIKDNVIDNILKTGNYYFKVVEIFNTEDTLRAIGYWADLKEYYPTIEKAIDTLKCLPDLEVVTDSNELEKIIESSLNN